MSDNQNSCSRPVRGKPPVGAVLERQDRQLRFAHLNRQQPDPGAAVGGLLREEFSRRCSVGSAWQRRVIALLEEHTGLELLPRISGVELRRGVLRLEVAEAAARYDLGLRWQQRLLEIVRSHLPAAGIHAVRFVIGGSGKA